MKLPQEFLAIELEELIEKNVQVRMMGHPEDLPSHTVSAMEEAVAKTAGNDGLVLNFALNYGSRKEITESVKALGREVRDGILRPEDITEELIGQRLLTGELPDPDLLIRTSGAAK